jgi:hypothetical protein
MRASRSCPSLQSGERGGGYEGGREDGRRGGGREDERRGGGEREEMGNGEEREKGASSQLQAPAPLTSLSLFSSPSPSPFPSSLPTLPLPFPLLFSSPSSSQLQSPALLTTHYSLPSSLLFSSLPSFPFFSYKPQKISPKFEGSVRSLLHKKIRESYLHPQFNADVMKPLSIEVREGGDGEE